MRGYYYLNSSNVSVGPLPMTQLLQRVEAGIISQGVLVCEAGGNAWRPLSDFSDVPSDTPSLPLPPPPPALALVRNRYSVSPVSFRTGTFTSTYNSSTQWHSPVALVTGILSLPAACVPLLGLPLAALGLVFGILGLRSVNEGQRSLASFGLACAAISLLISMAMLFMGGSFGGPAAAIDEVLRQGAQLGPASEKNHPGNLLAQCQYITAGLQRIDTRACPSDFRVAYQRHVQAWQRALPYIAANTPVTAFWEVVVGGSTGDLSIVGGANYQAQRAAQEINRTYDELMVLAAAYGSQIPSP